MVSISIEFTEKLIEEVRNRPIIYLLSHPEYKNNTKKLQAWREIGRELNEEVSVLKVKWKNLKDTYKKYKQSQRTSSGQAAKKLHNWAWASHMNFIDPSVSLNETQSNMTVPDENISDNASSISLNNQEEIGQRSADNERVQESIVSETQNAQVIYRRHRRSQDPTDKMIDYLRTRKRDQNNNDRIDIKYDGIDYLFLGYADTFKKLSKRTQVSVKFQIAKVMMEAELTDLDTDPPQFHMTTPATPPPGSFSIISDTGANLNLASHPVLQQTFRNYTTTSDATEHETQTSRDNILPSPQPTDLSTTPPFNSAHNYKFRL